VRLVHDPEKGTAGLDLVEDAEIAETVDTETGVNLDFDEDGNLVSVEIWASDRIPEQFFKSEDVEVEDLEAAAEVFITETGTPECDILVDYYMDPSTSDLEEGDELTAKKEIHLWLADLKKSMDFECWEEAEGARKLVEQAGLELGTHGRQILEKELEKDDGEGEEG
jgi:uncharacterized protein YuzE